MADVLWSDTRLFGAIKGLQEVCRNIYVRCNDALLEKRGMSLRTSSVLSNKVAVEPSHTQLAHT